MKAISLWQPWATLWLLSDPDEKVFETRSWHAAYRGPLLVHAAKTRNAEVRNFLTARFLHERLAIHGLNVADLEYGAIIGKVEMLGSHRMGFMPAPNEREDAFGNWSPERFAWQRAPNPERFARPIPFKGSQGFFDVPASVILAANGGDQDGAQMRLGDAQ